jgi:class 3 adenylate cyclase/tetratricopeptide (TPR) repeat protein
MPRKIRLNRMVMCARCGQENPEGFAYCGACGAPLAAEEAAREVRKTVTVVFSDVTGSTALGEQLDPESLRRVMGRYFDEMQSVVERHEGIVEKFIGDAVMAVFGIPVVHEDDALRAVRASMEMRERLSALNEELARDWGVTIAVRTGVNTGEVVAGDAGGGQRFATGDAVNVAKRFEEAAPPGEILLGEPTYRLVRDAVEIAEVEPQGLKGKSGPVGAYRLLSLQEDVPGRARRLDSPMVGRERELAALEQAYQRAVGERTCHLFTLLGAAGVGKSRLVSEFLAGVGDEATIMRGRCLPYGEGITYWPLAEALRERYGDDPLARIEGALEGDEARLITERVAAAVDLGGTPGPSDETAWAVRRLFEAEGRTQPLVVLFDDLQWAETTFLDLVEHLAEWSHDAPILLICIARPEFLDERPSWSGGKFNATSVLLERLNDGESAQLVANLLGRAQLDEDVRNRIMSAAEGNPLFVEEMLGMLIDDGLLTRSDGNWIAADDLSQITVPPTIHALLAARLDRLGRDERAVIERGSVEGKVFHRGAVAELSTEQLRESVWNHLQNLVRKELIRPDRTDLPGEDAFRFRHLLIRDAAYEAMPKELRAELHERFADWLNQMGSENLAEQDEIVGYHLEQSFRYRAELAPVDAEAERLALRAGERLGRAASRAMRRSDVAATIGLSERALTLLPETHEMQPRLLLNLGQSLHERGDLDEAETAYDDGLVAANLADDRGVGALIEARKAALRTMRGGTMDEGRETLHRLAEELEARGDEAALGEVLFLLGQHVSWTDDDPSEVLEQGARIAHELGNPRLEAACIGWLCIDAFWYDRPVEEGLRLCARLLDRPNAGPETSQLLLIAGLLKRLAGREEEGLADVKEGEAMLMELGDLVHAHSYSMSKATVSLLAGRVEEAEQVALPGRDALSAFGETGYLSTVSAIAALAIAAQGRYGEAEPFVEEARALGADDDLATQCLWRAAQARILAGRGQNDAALELAEESVRLLAPRRFLDRILLCISAAEVQKAAGREQEARQLLEQARSLRERKGIVIGEAWFDELLASV